MCLKCSPRLACAQAHHRRQYTLRLDFRLRSDYLLTKKSIKAENVRTCIKPRLCHTSMEDEAYTYVLDGSILCRNVLTDDRIMDRSYYMIEQF